MNDVNNNMFDFVTKSMADFFVNYYVEEPTYMKEALDELSKTVGREYGFRYPTQEEKNVFKKCFDFPDVEGNIQFDGLPLGSVVEQSVTCMDGQPVLTITAGITFYPEETPEIIVKDNGYANAFVNYSLTTIGHASLKEKNDILNIEVYGTELPSKFDDKAYKNIERMCANHSSLLPVEVVLVDPTRGVLQRFANSGKKTVVVVTSAYMASDAYRKLILSTAFAGRKCYSYNEYLSQHPNSFYYYSYMYPYDTYANNYLVLELNPFAKYNILTSAITNISTEGDKVTYHKNYGDVATLYTFYPDCLDRWDTAYQLNFFRNSKDKRRDDWNDVYLIKSSVKSEVMYLNVNEVYFPAGPFSVLLDEKERKVSLHYKAISYKVVDSIDGMERFSYIGIVHALDNRNCLRFRTFFSFESYHAFVPDLQGMFFFKKKEKRCLWSSLEYEKWFYVHMVYMDDDPVPAYITLEEIYTYSAHANYVFDDVVDTRRVVLDVVDMV